MAHSLKASEFILAVVFVIVVASASIAGVDMTVYEDLWNKAFYVVSGYGIFRQGNKFLTNGKMSEGSK